MAIGASINQVTQIGVETTEGTVVPAVRRLGSLGIAMSPQMDVAKLRARGAKYASGHIINREWSEGSAEGAAAYNEMPYPLASIYSKPIVTNLLGTFQATTAYTLGQAIIVGGFILVVTVAGTSGASAPTPGAIGTTSTSGGVTFKNVASSTSQSFTEMIFDTQQWAKDNIQTYTLEAIDTQRARAIRMSNAAFTELTLESMRGDEMTAGGTVVGKLMDRGVTPTTAGLIQDQPIYAAPSHINVYLDDTWASLGTTKLEANFGYNYSFSDRFNQAWVHDRANPSFKQLIESEPSLTLELTLADDEVGDTILADARKGDRSFVRFEALGPEIWPGSSVYYSLVIDMCCQVSDAPETDDEEDSYVITIPLEVEYDAVAGKATQARVRSKLAAL